MSDGRHVTAGTVGVLLIAMLLFTGLTYAAVTSLTPLSSISAYQGIHPEFVAVWYKGDYYTTSVTHESSVSRIGPATMNFDPDKPAEGVPNLGGELQDIQIIDDLSKYSPEATMSHIVSAFGGDPQPDRAYRTYEWEVEDRTYVMELWLCSMEINLFVRPDWNPIPGIGEKVNQRYIDTEVWLRIRASNEWGNYFKDIGVDNTYFGLAYLELAEITGTGDDTAMQLLPMARWAAFDIHESVGDQGKIPDQPDDVAFSYQGTTLSEDVFKKEWFTKITLANFGTYGWTLFGGGAYKSDTVSIKAIAHVFVVGEWIVKPPTDQDLEEHVPPWMRTWYQGFNDAIKNWMSNPWTRIKLAVGATVFILTLGILFYPPLGGWLVKNAFKAEKGVREEVKKRKKPSKKRK